MPEPSLNDLLNVAIDAAHDAGRRTLAYFNTRVAVETKADNTPVTCADRETKRPFDPKRRVGAEVCTQVRRHGVIIRPLGDVVVLMPPLAMGVDDRRRIVAAVAAEVQALG